MADQHRFAWTFFALLAWLVLAATAPVSAQDQPGAGPSAADSLEGAKPQPKPIRKGRVFVWDLQGTWISKPYLEKLKTSRSPHAAARQTPALVIKVEKENRTYPILVTDFQKAVLKFLIEVEPGAKPGSYRMVTAPEDGIVNTSDVTYINFRGERNAEGKFDTLSIADPHIAKRKFFTFVRLADSLDAVVNRLVIAGSYKDEQDAHYAFTDSGEASLPDRKFVYEVSLDPRISGCELLLSHREREPQGEVRLGFGWKGNHLQLFRVKSVSKDRYTCDAKPFAVLTAE